MLLSLIPSSQCVVQIQIPFTICLKRVVMTTSHRRCLPCHTEPGPWQKTLRWPIIQLVDGFLVLSVTAVSLFKSVALNWMWGLTYCLGWAQSSCSQVSIHPRVRLPNLATSMCTVAFPSWLLKFSLLSRELNHASALFYTACLYLLCCLIYLVHSSSKTEHPSTVSP